MRLQPPSIEKIVIRPASPHDHLTVRTLQIETFRETFAVFNTPENMNRYLEETFNETQVKNELNTAASFFFLAEWEGSPVGYLKLNTAPAQTDIHDLASLEIERIYVKQAMQGKKIGLALMNYALEIAQAKNADYVWLGVWENNTPAIVFYKKAGFTVFGEHQFTLGDDIQKDLLMKKSIRSETNSGVSK